MKVLSLVAITGFSLFCFVAQAQGASGTEYHKSVQSMIVHDDPAILLDNVRIIDGTGSEALEERAVLLRDGLIESIAPAGTLSTEGVKVIDGSEHTLMPGYVMLHEHLLYLNPAEYPRSYTTEHLPMPPLYLAAGTTTLRTAGTFDADDDLRAKELIENGQLAGPDLFVTAPYIEGPGGFAYQLRPITNTKEVRQYVRYWVKAGATSFKAYMNVSREVLGAAVKEAHRHGAQFTGHLCSVTFREAAALGIDNLEHGLTEATDIFPNKQQDACPETSLKERIPLMALENPEVQSLIARLVQEKVAITSTLPVLAAGIHPAIPSQESLRLLSTRSRNVAQERWISMLLPEYSDRKELRMELLKREMAFEKAFVEAGGNLVVGTDPTGWGGTVPPNSTHAALELLVEAGFTPLEVLSMATMNGARFLGVDNEVGSVEAGKRANLVLVKGQPDVDIRASQNVRLVFKDGVAFSSEALIQSVRGNVGR